MSVCCVGGNCGGGGDVVGLTLHALSTIKLVAWGMII